jgi:hypothetical protein
LNYSSMIATARVHPAEAPRRSDHSPADRTGGSETTSFSIAIDRSTIRRGIAFPFLEQPLDCGLFDQTRQLAANGIAALSEPNLRPHHGRQRETGAPATLSFTAAGCAAWSDPILVHFPQESLVTRELTLVRSLPSGSTAYDLPFSIRNSIAPDLDPSITGLGISAPYSR